jgi:hypothetical protein
MKRHAKLTLHRLQTMLQHGLVDELRLVVFPLPWG